MAHSVSKGTPIPMFTGKSGEWPTWEVLFSGYMLVTNEEVYLVMTGGTEEPARSYGERRSQIPQAQRVSIRKDFIGH